MNSSSAPLVAEFHEAFDLIMQMTPGPVPPDIVAIRQRLFDEEVSEVAVAVQSGDLVAIAHELADVVYIAYGTALAYGVDLDAVIAEVHRANMSKLDGNGQPVLINGKVQKGPHYQPPDVAGVVHGTA